MTSLPAARAQVIFGSEVSTENLLAFDGSTLAGVIKGPRTHRRRRPRLRLGQRRALRRDGLESLHHQHHQRLRQPRDRTFNPTGLAYDPGLHRLSISDTGSNELYSHALGTSTLSLSGTISGGFSFVEGLDFDPGSGVLFATRVGANLLTSVAPLTGIGTDFGPITGAGSPNLIQGLAAIHGRARTRALHTRFGRGRSGPAGLPAPSAPGLSPGPTPAVLTFRTPPAGFPSSL